jgi:conjugal transfer pilus assembly protein TrbC
MADLEEAELLRAVILGLLALLGLALRSAAEAPIPDFAPGAQGPVEAPLPQLMNEAERRAEALRQRLELQEAAPESAFGVDIGAIAPSPDAADRVRRALGLDPVPEAQGAGAPGGAERYDDAQAFVFASFSMPGPSLRQLFEESHRLGVPVVIRGFVGNSVHETRAALERIFAETGEARGFLIDPTIFARFEITAVPVVVVARDPLTPCLSQACADDPVPVHDRLSGNVPLPWALERIAAGGGDADAVAARILARATAR